ncbi:MAG: bifunctional 4-hydroxy-2-oxoglutarate aldolase/2-dehydro-3-deoxy-phosphogluconate aldolase, partial [Candidatus Omnitrophica bacterium]|nr:bifunctional 4-hydroxy-2-oxoglutarate aldolase/2-dehydro-3-deoxy-phosphogluconate aldolase [Candidatus Omnitrophota bacterium]
MKFADFRRLPLLGIIRGLRAEAVDPLTDQMIASGLKTVEITMNTPGAPDLIRRMVRRARGKLTVGAGTVLDTASLQSALKAGATFIVSPVLVPKVAAYCMRRDIPVFPGALTPQEIYQAWEAGASMVKVFPVRFFGPEYLREVKGPLEKIR